MSPSQTNDGATSSSNGGNTSLHPYYLQASSTQSFSAQPTTNGTSNGNGYRVMATPTPEPLTPPGPPAASEPSAAPNPPPPPASVYRPLSTTPTSFTASTRRWSIGPPRTGTGVTGAASQASETTPPPTVLMEQLEGTGAYRSGSGNNP